MPLESVPFLEIQTGADTPWRAARCGSVLPSRFAIVCKRPVGHSGLWRRMRPQSHHQSPRRQSDRHRSWQLRKSVGSVGAPRRVVRTLTSPACSDPITRWPEPAFQLQECVRAIDGQAHLIASRCSTSPMAISNAIVVINNQNFVLRFFQHKLSSPWLKRSATPDRKLFVPILCFLRGRVSEQNETLPWKSESESRKSWFGRF